MPIDVSQFLQTFVEESLEMLHAAESTLLSLELNNINKDSIHKIFRCMHSIKGAASVFKFDSITELAHTLESYLDTIRSGEQEITQKDIDLLLRAIDCIQSIIFSIQNKSAIDDKSSKEINTIFQDKLLHPTNNTSDTRKKLSKTEMVEETNENQLGWKIKFTPSRDLFKQNTDPLNIFNELTELGELKITVNINQLPTLSNIDPHECYLSWEFELITNTSKNAIQELFGWIVDDENIQIEPLENITLQPLTKEKDNINANASHAEQQKMPISVRVSTEKIDHLINLIGELVITQSMLNEICNDLDSNQTEKLKEGLNILENNSRELQENVMRIRMVPIDFIFNRFVRMTHDIAAKVGKEVQLVITGEQTEIDKNMIEKITDPLVHLIRNAIDHGIELPDLRKKNNKSLIGVIQLNAYQEADDIIIDVADDGAGLNKEKIREKALAAHLINDGEEVTDDQIYQCIFQPGFSTNADVSDISGRGVGLDVVYKNINELGGQVEIKTKEGEGTTFRLRLPLTMAIMDCQLVKINNDIYIIPLINISEIIKIDAGQLNKVDNKTVFYSLRNNFIPLIYLNQFFFSKNVRSDFENKFLIVVEANNRISGLVVDELLSQQQIVIKTLEENYEKVPGIAGVTILGNGSVGLIVDVKSVISQTLNLVTLNENNLANDVQKIQPKDLILEKILSQSHDIFHFLSFTLAEQEYGIDILAVKEIRTWEEVTMLPNTPAYIKGIINVRGMIIPVIDLYEQFGMKGSVYGPHSVIIILMRTVSDHNNFIGVLADHVSNTYSIQYKEIKPMIENNNEKLKAYIEGFVDMDDKMIALLNTNYLNSIVLTSTMVTQEMA